MSKALEVLQGLLRDWKREYAEVMNQLEELRGEAEAMQRHIEAAEAKQGEIAAIDRRVGALEGELQHLQVEFSTALFWRADRGSSCLERRDVIQSEISELQDQRAALVGELEAMEPIDGEAARALYDAADHLNFPPRPGGMLEEAGEEALIELVEARESVQSAAQAAYAHDPEGWHAVERREDAAREQAHRAREQRRYDAQEQERRRQVEKLRSQGRRVRLGGNPESPADYVS